MSTGSDASPIPSPFCSNSPSATAHKNVECDDAPEAATSSDHPLVPNCPADWEAKKEIIYELYIQQNRILNDVVSIMLSTHRFRATARMYKSQFVKWKWSKYNKSNTCSLSRASKLKIARRKSFVKDNNGICSGGSSDSALQVTKLPCRSDDFRLSQQSAPAVRLLYQNEDALQIEATLNAYGTYISSWSERDTPWKTESSFRQLLGRQDNSILQNVSAAGGHFRKHDIVQGGDFLRRAFIQIEDAVSTGFDIEAIWDCCLAVPQLLLSLRWYDVLRIFTEYVYHLASIKLNSEHPIVKIAHNIWKLATTNPSQLQLYIDRAWKLWIDLVSRLRGDHDYVTIHLKRGYVILINPDQSIVSSLISDFGRSVQNSLTKHGEAQTTSRILELEQLLVRMYIPLFSPETSARAQMMLFDILRRIENKAENKDVPVNESDYLDRYLFFSAYHFLASIEDYNGNHEQAVYYRRKSLESPKDLFWLQTALRLEEYLRSVGRDDEAGDILRERMQVPLVEYHEHPAMTD
ncbi:Clr5 domain-containing protein [Bombardia bombarda]|uniref:Clr5 domain-containing protein n=1 Tax=Bombardia bombarda TaxID=252184 RepID=A0AA39WCD5_9PEZI|nr:Clr5 domain-containing protein [Bombardia bombarda]